MPLLDVILGYDCNLACDYCTITPAMRARALSTGAVLRALDEGRARGFTSVSFTGGEPTIRADLLGLVRAARDRGYDDVKVQSNGLVFAHAPNLDPIVAAGATRFHLSLHTHLPDAYDALVGRAGAFPLFLAALDHVVARRLPLVVDVILKRDTYARLPDALAFLAGRGVRNVDLWLVSLTDGNRDNVGSLPRVTELLPDLRRALAFARGAGMTVRSLHLPRCLLGDDAAHAHDPGGERVRVVTPDATFDLADSRLAGQVHVPACDGCPHRPVCPGLRPDYLARFGDAEIVAARAAPPSPSSPAAPPSSTAPPRALRRLPLVS